MDRTPKGVALAMLLLVAACSAPGAQTSPDSGTSDSPAASLPVEDPSVLVVAAHANIFGAGFADPPAPAGGGRGILPPAWQLPQGSNRIVTFPRVDGRVNPIIDMADYNGPEGDLRGPTDVESYQGISGIVHGGNGMFLVGVFLSDGPPTDPAPERLDFTNGEDFEVLEPEIAQTFFIGDGVGHAYRVPDGATRLFLGFADAFLYKGAPGWYGNNAGELEVKVEVATD